MSNWAAKFQAIVADLNPVHAKFLARAFSNLSSENSDELGRYVDYCAKDGITIEYLAECYNLIVTDTQIEQIYFKRNKRYRCSTFKEVADAVYFSNTYMPRYMHGLALTTFLWPNHLAMRDFFVKTFPAGTRGEYLEIGPGHGYYFTKASALGSFDFMTGIDISASSVALTRKMLQHFAVDRDKVKILEADFLQFDPGVLFSCIVMGEVLEHVERPELFLEKIAKLAEEDTYIYITTAVNSPAIDHIYLFRSSEEVEQLMRKCGLEITDKLCLPHPGVTLEEAYARAMSVNVAYVARKL
jgi:2-polyprenyl-3-methyl-5-hydroxy-6-metoxy-1,4-benzoquinol methylase